MTCYNIWRVIYSIVIVVVLVFSWRADSSKVKKKHGYIDKMFGHIHRHPSRESASITLLSCGQKVLLDHSFKKNPGKWHMVTSGVYKGYIRRENISMTPPSCFQDAYPRFFESFDLGPSLRYHWGKLYDQYEYGHSRAK